MKIKKYFLYLATILIIFGISQISASSFDFEDANYRVTGVIEKILGFLSPFLEKIIGDYSTSEFFFHKCLLLLALVLILKNVLEKMPLGEKNEKLSLMLSIIMSILAIRFINENDFFESIFIQYGVLGIAITTILPTIIFFYFIHKTKVGTMGRKLFWILYILIMGMIWISKFSNLPTEANFIYIFIIIAGLFLIIFDKTVHSYFGLSDLKHFQIINNRKRIRELKVELEKIEEHFQKRRMSFQEYKEEKKAIEENIKELSKE